MGIKVSCAQFAGQCLRSNIVFSDIASMSLATREHPELLPGWVMCEGEKLSAVKATLSDALGVDEALKADRCAACKWPASWYHSHHEMCSAHPAEANGQAQSKQLNGEAATRTGTGENARHVLGLAISL